MQTQITQRAHGMDTYVDEYMRDGQNRLIVPRYETLTGQVDFVVVQIYQWAVWKDFPVVWNNLASPCPIRGEYVYQVSGESWEKQASETLAATPADCQFIALDIEKTGNTLDKTFFADASRILRYWQANSKMKVFYYANQDMYMNYILPVMTKNYPHDHWYDIDFDIWVASWPLLKPLRSPDNNPNLPKGMRADWKLLQYTDALDKPTYGSLDGDVFNGPVSAMRAWLHLDQVPAPAPVPAPIPAPTPDPVPVPVPNGPTLTHEIDIMNDGSIKVDGKPYA